VVGRWELLANAVMAAICQAQNSWHGGIGAGCSCCHPAHPYDRTREIPEENSPVLASGRFLPASESVPQVGSSEAGGHAATVDGASKPGGAPACWSWTHSPARASQAPSGTHPRPSAPHRRNRLSAWHLRIFYALELRPLAIVRSPPRLGCLCPGKGRSKTEMRPDLAAKRGSAAVRI